MAAVLRYAMLIGFFRAIAFSFSFFAMFLRYRRSPDAEDTPPPLPAFLRFRRLILILPMSLVPMPYFLSASRIIADATIYTPQITFAALSPR